MTLTDFLLARIAEDEAVARADERDRERDFGKTDSLLFSSLANVGTGYMEYPAISIDSTRVLAECEAKRRIVELHGDIDPDGTLYGGPCGICAECGGNDNEVELPCPTLRFLALPCADHPDYREEWRP